MTQCITHSAGLSCLPSLDHGVADSLGKEVEVFERSHHVGLIGRDAVSPAPDEVVGVEVGLFGIGERRRRVRVRCREEDLRHVEIRELLADQLADLLLRRAANDRQVAGDDHRLIDHAVGVPRLQSQRRGQQRIVHLAADPRVILPADGHRLVGRNALAGPAVEQLSRFPRGGCINVRR